MHFVPLGRIKRRLCSVAWRPSCVPPCAAWKQCVTLYYISLESLPGCLLLLLVTTIHHHLHQSIFHYWQFVWMWELYYRCTSEILLLIMIPHDRLDGQQQRPAAAVSTRLPPSPCFLRCSVGLRHLSVRQSVNECEGKLRPPYLFVPLFFFSSSPIHRCILSCR